MPAGGRRHTVVTDMPSQYVDHKTSATGAVDTMAALSASPITVVLADDHRVVRSGLRMLLESDGRFSVLDEAGDVAGAIATVRACRPRVLVLDLNMGGESSLEAIPVLRAEIPAPRSWC